MHCPRGRFPEQPPSTNDLRGPRRGFVTGTNKRPRVLDFVHSLNYMNSDLKSLNIFLDANMVAKLADLGMNTNKHSSLRKKR